MSSSWAGRRTSTGSTPIERSTATCSAKAPWSASTPIFIVPAPTPGRSLPAADRQPLALGDRLDRDALHRAPEALRDLGDDLGVLEVRGGLDDGVGHPRRILALEDARADEHALRPQLHHERRVG